MGIVYGLGAALFWGLGDFAITALARIVGTARCLLYIQIFSLASWIALIALFPHKVAPGLNPWLIAGLAGIFHVAGLATTYRAFEIGTLSFVSPIASSFAIVSTLLFVITGDAPAALAMLGILMLVGGIIVVTRSTTSEGPVTLRGVPEAIVSALTFGVMFWILDVYVKQPLGDVYPLILLKTMATMFAAGYVGRTKYEPSADASIPRLVGIAFLAAILDTLAWMSYLFGTNQPLNGAVVVALASLFSVVTVVMAGIFLKEQLNKMQWLGVGIVLGGILLVSLPK
ncbi:MAG TPA: DMT family transporter [Fimbriimonadaceae bacterium]|nr:DMT family transporter [Fimbriimonadaceae bacterium]